MLQKIIIWDNDETIMGSADPADETDNSKILLPNVKKIMTSGNILNIICSGGKTPESERQDFNTEDIIEKFKVLMTKLPIKIAAFSPAIGGAECYVLFKKSDLEGFEVRKAHEDLRYCSLIGHFKKPGIGMLKVIQDLVKEEFKCELKNSNTVFIGDSGYDEEAAKNMRIPFIEARHIHQGLISELL